MHGPDPLSGKKEIKSNERIKLGKLRSLILQPQTWVRHGIWEATARKESLGHKERP